MKTKVGKESIQHMTDKGEFKNTVLSFLELLLQGEKIT